MSLRLASGRTLVGGTLGILLSQAIAWSFVAPFSAEVRLPDEAAFLRSGLAASLPADASARFEDGTVVVVGQGNTPSQARALAQLIAAASAAHALEDARGRALAETRRVRGEFTTASSAPVPQGGSDRVATQPASPTSPPAIDPQPAALATAERAIAALEAFGTPAWTSLGAQDLPRGVAELSEQAERAREDVVALEATLGPRHPSLQQARRRSDALDARLSDAVDTALASLRRARDRTLAVAAGPDRPDRPDGEMLQEPLVTGSVEAPTPLADIAALEGALSRDALAAIEVGPARPNYQALLALGAAPLGALVGAALARRRREHDPEINDLDINLLDKDDEKRLEPDRAEARATNPGSTDERADTVVAPETPDVERPEPETPEHETPAPETPERLTTRLESEPRPALPAEPVRTRIGASAIRAAADALDDLRRRHGALTAVGDDTVGSRLVRDLAEAVAEKGGRTLLVLTDLDTGADGRVHAPEPFSMARHRIGTGELTVTRLPALLSPPGDPKGELARRMFSLLEDGAQLTLVSIPGGTASRSATAWPRSSRARAHLWTNGSAVFVDHRRYEPVRVTVA